MNYPSYLGWSPKDRYNEVGGFLRLIPCKATCVFRYFWTGHDLAPWNWNKATYPSSSSNLSVPVAHGWIKPLRDSFSKTTCHYPKQTETPKSPYHHPTTLGSRRRGTFWSDKPPAGRSLPVIQSCRRHLQWGHSLAQLLDNPPI